MLCLIHPNVAVMWNKIRCRICATWCAIVMLCNGRCEMWPCDVEWWCGAWGMWWCAVMQDVVLEYRVMWNAMV